MFLIQLFVGLSAILYTLKIVKINFISTDPLMMVHRWWWIGLFCSSDSFVKIVKIVGRRYNLRLTFNLRCDFVEFLDVNYRIVDTISETDMFYKL